ncbi:uncharacterized protein LOC119843220 isoform X2 [Dermochelys coriacea]|uniref:uncharacterized protein LOC119843220 isoform X2 n=1 Tax=Dermochelys coriacea TaxID=27794 RepID=UPI001CA887B0|nr:uncharacterized protein LOC119843220 isoform X2 [Dermochelys coriacea]
MIIVTLLFRLANKKNIKHLHNGAETFLISSGFAVRILFIMETLLNSSLPSLQKTWWREKPPQSPELDPWLNVPSCFKRNCFHDEVMVDVLERADQQVQYQKKSDKRLELWHDDRQEDRLRFAVQVEDRFQLGSRQLQSSAWHRKAKGGGQSSTERTISATPVHNGCKSTLSRCLSNSMA